MIIEDDSNDAEVIVTAIREIGIPNEIMIMRDAESAYDYLSTTDDHPYLILCDIRMPGTDGLTFRSNIIHNDYLKKKSIPFIFFTGIVSQETVNIAYELEVQGFFQKATSYPGIRDQLLSIFMYWKQCLHPNKKIEASQNS